MSRDSINLQAIVRNVRKNLRAQVDPVYRKGSRRFFKEPIKILGVRTPLVRQLARSHARIVREASKSDVLKACENLLHSGWNEEATVAFAWAVQLRKRFESKDLILWERWIKRYVTNWSLCDDFCSHIVGSFIERFPEFLPRVANWSNSKNRWFRRASAVSLIIGLRRGRFLKEAFKIADALLIDQDDLVQKGYGWMLKEGSHRFPNEIFDFVMKRRDRMPRTALRYAIEKYPAAMRKKAMS